MVGADWAGMKLLRPFQGSPALPGMGMDSRVAWGCAGLAWCLLLPTPGDNPALEQQGAPPGTPQTCPEVPTGSAVLPTAPAPLAERDPALHSWDSAPQNLILANAPFPGLLR